MTNPHDSVVLLGPSERFRAQQVSRGFDVVHAEASRFPDGELLVRVPDAERLRGRRVLVVQSGSRLQDSSLMTMLQLLDVAGEAGAAETTCFAPYLCYQRQDRACDDGEPVTARLVLRMLAAAGARRVICLDRHSRTSEGPGLPELIDISCAAALAASSARRSGVEQPDLVLAPDEGARARAAAVAAALGVPLVCLKKTKDARHGTGFSALPAETAGRRALIVEDLCSTGSTLVPLHERLLAVRAEPSYFVTHLLADPDLIVKRLAGARRVSYSDSCGHRDAAVQVLPLALDAWAAASA